MFRYRPDQGVYARGTAFWSLLIFAYLAGNRFYYWTQGWGDWPNHLIVKERVAVLGIHLTPAWLMGVGLFLGLLGAIWAVVNHPKLADLLIDTEQEMRKVTWPSFEDCKKSSLVVIGCVVFLLGFLFVADFALTWVFQDLIY